MMLKVLFKGREYVLPSGNLQEGAIATEMAYRTGRPSEAHLYRNGNISRYGESIGTVADLTVLGEIEDLEIAEDAFDNMLNHPGWRRR